MLQYGYPSALGISMQAHEGMDALVFNLRQEHVVICDFVSTFHQVPPPPLVLAKLWLGLGLSLG
jgi:hypothetical protein